MSRLLLVGLFLLAWSSTAVAYTVVLKDGRRIEVKDGYRQINTVIVFTKPDGKPFSVSFDNIDVATTEKVNGQKSGDFRKNCDAPLPISDGVTPPPVVASNVPKKSPTRPARVLTNADFGGGRPSPPEPPDEKRPAEAAEKPNFKPATDERDTEAYWQGRVRPLLMEMQIQLQLYNSLSAQAEQLERKIAAQPKVYVRSPGGYVYIPQETNGSDQYELARVRDRLNDVNAQLTSLRVRYAYIQEEARRNGVPPGWIR